jgi:hypothetical protein
MAMAEYVRCKVVKSSPHGILMCPHRATQWVLGVRPDSPAYKLPVCDLHALDWMVDHREPMEDVDDGYPAA